MLALRCSETQATFTLEREGADRWLARLEAANFSAQASVYVYRGEGLGEFFTGLARDWRGFEGVRSWGSLEGELEIDATADGRGHTRCDLRLVLDAERTQRCEASIVLEAGELDRVALAAVALAGP